MVEYNLNEIRKIILDQKMGSYEKFESLVQEIENLKEPTRKRLKTKLIEVINSEFALSRQDIDCILWELIFTDIFELSWEDNVDRDWKLRMGSICPKCGKFMDFMFKPETGEKKDGEKFTYMDIVGRKCEKCGYVNYFLKEDWE